MVCRRQLPNNRTSSVKNQSVQRLLIRELSHGLGITVPLAVTYHSRRSNILLRNDLRVRDNSESELGAAQTGDMLESILGIVILGCDEADENRLVDNAECSNILS